MLAQLDQVSEEMEPFGGTDEERELLAGFLIMAASGEEPEPAISGQAVFEENCSACHAADELVEPFTGAGKEEILSMLATLDQISDEMVPFDGSIR